MSDMIEETATVVRLEQGSAWVSIKTRSACGHCGSSSDCGTAMVAQLFGEKENLLRLDNSLDVEVGEQVVIGVPNTMLLKASILAYMLPLIALIVMVGMGRWMGLGDDFSTALGFIGLGLGLWVTNRITGGATGRKAYCPVMLRRARHEFIPSTIGFTTGVKT
jgi:sigma-E factor negative regulatory protein RseC